MFRPTPAVERGGFCPREREAIFRGSYFSLSQPPMSVGGCLSMSNDNVYSVGLTRSTKILVIIKHRID